MNLLGIELNQKQTDQFNKYYELLTEWNNKINLTAITEYDEVLIKHFEDSISIINAFNIDSVESIIDIGTGAGFPGVPIKILFPNIKVTLLDSLNKRINFLNLVIEELELENIFTFHGRAEDFAKNINHREKYDLAVSRAVANLSSLSELCLPFVKVGGSFVSYKSEKVNEELELAGKAISIMGGGNTCVKSISLSVPEYARNLVVINKVTSTPNKYPRKAGTPIKNPII